MKTAQDWDKILKDIKKSHEISNIHKEEELGDLLQAQILETEEDDEVYYDIDKAKIVKHVVDGKSIFKK